MRTDPVDRLPPADPDTLDLFPDMVWIADGDGTVVFVNRAFRIETGYDGPVTPDIFERVVHPDEFARERARWRACVDEGKPFENEVRLRTADGRYAWFRSRGTRIADGSGWIGVLTRITEERAARDRAALLAASNGLFVALTDPNDVIDGLLSILVPLYADYAIVDLFNADGTFDCCVVAGEDAVKAGVMRTRERYAAAGAVSMEGTSWHVARHGGTVVVGSASDSGSLSQHAIQTNHELGVRSAIVVALDDGRQRLGALSLGRIAPDAEPFEAADVPFYVDLGARAASAIVHARTTSALVESERIYRSLADQLPDLVGLTRPDGTIMYLNEASNAYTGRNFDQRAGLSGWQEDIHPDDLPKLEAEFKKALANSAPLEIQYRLRRHDGVYRWFLNRGLPIRDKNGTMTAWIGVATDIDERKRAEDALRVAVEVGGVFAPTLDTSVALQLLADVAIEHLADWCGVHLLDGSGNLVPVAIAHKDQARVRFIREYIRRYSLGESMLRVALDRVIERVNDIPPEAYEAIADPEQREMAKALGLRAIMNVPLFLEGENYGVLSLAISESDRTFADEDERLAMLIAQRAAIAIGNARLFERQRDVARELQATFLPASFPAIDGVQFDAIYVPGSRDLTIGGDWYDAFAYDDETLALSVGDVAGHGLDSAVRMGKVRQAFRALSVVERDPACLVSVADSVVRREHPDTFVTAFVGTLDLRTSRLRYTLAGHPAPFIRSCGGTLRRLRDPNVPLGLAELDDIETHEEQLHRGELLVAFTDGLIESDHDILAGEMRVARALDHPAFEICTAPAQLLRALTVPPAVEDDVAILAVRMGRGPDWSFDANDAVAAQAARGEFAARLRAEGLGDDMAMAGEIVFGEIVGNVARYTPGPVDIALRRDGERLVLAALDRGPGFAWSTRIPEATSESGRGLYLIEALAAASRLEHFAGFGAYIEIALAI